MTTKRKIILALLAGWLIGAVIHEAKAGMFLDLDIGAHLQDWPEQTYNGEPALGSENPIGIIRVGYQTTAYQLWKQVDISAHGYYEHMSSAGTHNDSGVDVLMFGIRFE